MLLSSILNEIGLSLEGNDKEINGIHTLSEAGPSQLSFFNNDKYKDELSYTKAGAVLIEEKYAYLLPQDTIAIITNEPYLKLALASKLFAYNLTSKTTKPTVGDGCDMDESVIFGSNVTIGDGVTILGGCYIGDNVVIGSNTLLHPNATIYHHTLIGERCIIHSGAVIGSDGFGFAHTRTGEHVKIYQNGNVIIEDDVEIGANSTIDRAVFGTTFVRTGTKIDNLVQIGHNCDIGAYSLLAAQVGMSGSTVLGRNVVMGGQSASAGHLKIGDFATIAGKSGVTKTLEGGKTYAGFPAVEHNVWLRSQAKLASLLKKQK
ncbi:MAG: UDP-3-O-(3-hydroxymyristoyl)glucosamine N-acyltransferase [Campylobacterales bacterium]|nr:UDP-3-O-(3-hydroxymyristoyl)glucosamine N-acyltransferase [Campylobacterales bacterium]